MNDSSVLEADRRRWQRIEDVFHRAAELAPDERSAFLEQSCAGDPTLRGRVEALLAADLESVDAVAQLLVPAGGSVLNAGELGTGTELETEARPERIGPYRILRELGRGGLSSVFLAERDDGTFRKHVALKLVRRGLDTRDILDRLRQERQILAHLDHPNIARLLDGGSAEDGRPYFVMEYVEGLPIDEFCRRGQLPLEERIELFRTVCAAVHTAHRNLTIHRDIKPSNILVTRDGVPKLLDFGIAKVLDADGSQATWHRTGPGMLYMTPAYASPEQIRGEALSTATDVYSLGVLLFRLLTGAAPFDLEGLPFHRLEAVICHSPAPRLSQRLSAASMAAGGLPASSERRLRSRLEGDLDTIATMALRKEPERRYSSAEQLGEDLRRHRQGLPVQARPDRWSYRAGKFVGRHRRALVAAGLMALTLAGVVSVYSYHLFKERNRAVEAYARAEMERAKSSRVTDFLQQIFEISNPSRSLGETVTARQLLDRGAAQIEEELAQQPEIQASLMEAISQSYAGLGLFEEAGAHLERSFEIYRQLFQPPHEALADAHEKLGDLRITQGRYDEAEEHLREALRQRRLLLGPEDPKVAESEGDLGALAHSRGRLAEAEDLYRRALARLELQPGPRDPETLLVQSNLVTLLYNQRRFEEAEALGRRVLAVQQEELGRNHPDTTNTEATLAAILVAAKRYQAAETLLRKLWQRQRELLGAEHPDVALAANNLAAALYYLGDYREAEVLYRQALAIQEKVHGERHAKTVATMLNLADLQANSRGQDAAARRLYERALALRRSLAPEGSVDLLNPLISLGELELRQGRPRIAQDRLKEAVEILEAEAEKPASRTEPWRLAEARSLLGEAYFRQGDLSKAEALMSSAPAILRSALGADHPKAVAASRRLQELREPPKASQDSPAEGPEPAQELKKTGS